MKEKAHSLSHLSCVPQGLEFQLALGQIALDIACPGQNDLVG